eukprot:scaffold110230_cov66-Phaeocystis_antarctica.AAC.5
MASVWPCCAAKYSGVALRSVCASSGAPASISALMAPASPDAAAACSFVLSDHVASDSNWSNWSAAPKDAPSSTNNLTADIDRHARTPVCKFVLQGETNDGTALNGQDREI